MAKVYLALGSNLGDCRANLLQAVRQIEERIGRVISLSAFYASAPWGFDSVNAFLNGVLLVDSDHTAISILQIIKHIESEMGRLQKTTNAYSDRVIDIDILFYDNDIVQMSYLVIPHPLLHRRMFVLEPLCEIAPDYIHPQFEKSISLLCAELKESEKSTKSKKI